MCSTLAYKNTNDDRCGKGIINETYRCCYIRYINIHEISCDSHVATNWDIFTFSFSLKMLQITLLFYAVISSVQKQHIGTLYPARCYNVFCSAGIALIPHSIWTLSLSCASRCNEWKIDSFDFIVSYILNFLNQTYNHVLKSSTSAEEILLTSNTM